MALLSGGLRNEEKLLEHPRAEGAPIHRICGMELLLVLPNCGERAMCLLLTYIIRNTCGCGDEHAAEVLDEALLQVSDGVVGLLQHWRPLQKLYV